MRTVDEQHDRLQSSVAAFEEGPTPGGVAYLQAQALTSIALELRELRLQLAPAFKWMRTSPADGIERQPRAAAHHNHALDVVCDERCPASRR